MAETPANSVNGKIVYYASFAGYSLPLKPVEELSQEEAMSRNTHCVGFYDGSGKLYRFEKYLNGQLFFRHDYKYHDNGNIRENRGIDADGITRINRYDVKGQRLRAP